MKLITKEMLIKEVAIKWRRQYPKSHPYGPKKDVIYGRLLELPHDATERDVAEIIGNSSWTRNKCDECQKDSDITVMLGNDSSTAQICLSCLQEAKSLVEK